VPDRRRAPALAGADGGLELGIGRVAGDGHDCGSRAARERVVDPVVRLHLCERRRKRVEAGDRGVQAQRRHREHHQRRRRCESGDERAAEHTIEDRAPDAALAVVAAESAQERDAHLVDAVAQPREDSRKDGQ